MTGPADALRLCRTGFLGAGVASAFVNILALTGSLYMLQVYDRVLPSRSVPTLVALTILMGLFYAASGILEYLRLRLLTAIGLRVDLRLRDQVFSALTILPLRVREGVDAMQPIRDLDTVRSFVTGPGPTALFDLPWMPLYLALVYMLHPLLGLLATAGAFVLVALALATEMLSRKPMQALTRASSTRLAFAEGVKRNAEVVHAMGMGHHFAAIWKERNQAYLNEHIAGTNITSTLGTISKVLRTVLQSCTLGLGAYLAISGEASAGVMIASSIIGSRALAPVEQAIAQWRNFIAARQSYARLTKVLNALPKEDAIVALERPSKSLVVQGLHVAAPGQTRAIVQNVSFTAEAGAGIGIIGPSASGKSTLARALVGVWQPMPQRGTIRLDGATLDQWPVATLGKYIGYLPQDIELFDGTVAQNIARFAPDATDAAIVAAARAAAVHELILNLPEGYQTRVGTSGAILSGGQRQRIGLARALYGDPFLVILDEPNSNLDVAGDTGLVHAIKSVRERGGIVIVIAHRPSVLIGLDQLMVMANGQIQAFGPKDEILRAAAGQVPNADTNDPQKPPLAASAGVFRIR